jgi:hypothetical protein
MRSTVAATERRDQATERRKPDSGGHLGNAASSLEPEQTRARNVGEDASGVHALVVIVGGGSTLGLLRNAPRLNLAGSKEAVCQLVDTSREEPIVSVLQRQRLIVRRTWMSDHCAEFKNADDRVRRGAIHILEDADWIEPTLGGTTYGGWPRERNVNGHLWRLFGQEGEARRLRRVAVREATGLVDAE